MLERRSSARSASELERLGPRRRKYRRLSHVLIALFVATLAGSFIWLSWQPSVRITEVVISTDDPATRTVVLNEFSGTYAGILPRDSFFFVPRSAIRAAVIEADAGIQAVSIRLETFTKVSVSLLERAPVALWCGTTPLPEEHCYVFDATGYVYAREATSTPPLNPFVVYDTLANATLEPLRATLTHAAELPDAFAFARRVGEHGSPVRSVTMHGDETDLTLSSGTRVTYVLGSEEEAFTTLLSANEALSLADGSLEYVDLRFPAKVYLKRRGDTVAQ